MRWWPCLPCREQLEKEKKIREDIEREKEQIDRERRDLMYKLCQYEKQNKKAEKGEAWIPFLLFKLACAVVPGHRHTCFPSKNKET